MRAHLSTVGSQLSDSPWTLLLPQLDAQSQRVPEGHLEITHRIDKLFDRRKFRLRHSRRCDAGQGPPRNASVRKRTSDRSTLVPRRYLGRNLLPAWTILMTTRIRTACTRDCPDACGLIATVEQGQVVRLEGDPEHPITKGFLCYRTGTGYLKRHASPERITAPQLRRDGKLVPISWTEAFDRAAGELDRIRRENGPAAVLHVKGGGSLGILKKLNQLFFRAFGATETRGELCDGAGTEACELDFGVAEQNAPEEILNARGVVLWGRDVTSSSPHSVPLLKQAARAGAEILLIDPLPQKAVRFADQFLQPRQGGDAALALGAGRVVLEQGWQQPNVAEYSEDLDRYTELVLSRSVAEWAREADLPESALFDLARFMKARAPVSGQIGWGLQRRQNGATQVRAINALFALTGNVGCNGAGPAYTSPRAAPFDLSMLTEREGEVPRTLLLPLLGQEIEAAMDPEIQAVVIDNANPVASNPDSEATRRALLSREFVLVIDPFLTDTAQVADLVLPCSMNLEEDDLVGSYGHHFITASRRVVEPRAGVRSDLEIYQTLAERLGFGPVMAGSTGQWIDRLLTTLKPGGLTQARLLERALTPADAASVAYAGRRFPTPSGKFRFLAQHVSGSEADPDYPLQLMAGSTRRWQTSQLTLAEEHSEGPLEVTVHPESAGGIEDGARARLESRIGTLAVRVRHDSGFRLDTAYVPRTRSHQLGQCVNALIRARLTDFGDSCAFLDEHVRLQAV